MAVEPHFQLDPEWTAVAECVDAFEEASSRGVPEIDPFLNDVQEDYRLTALAEIIMVDQELRWKRGERPRLAEYLETHPRLIDNAALLQGVLIAEYELRERHGEQPSAAEYQRTFPQFELPARTRTVADCATEALAPPTAPRQRPAGPPDRIGPYPVVAVLGQGSYGTVYRCRDEELRREVAVKVMHTGRGPRSESNDEFWHEARSAAGLHHSGIVDLLSTGETDDGQRYMVFRFLAGGTLEARITAADYQRNEAVEWIASLAHALHHVHKRGLVHRDIKPSNILFNAHGQPELTDFGLARVNDQFFADDTGRVLGTVAYMSPEQADGKSHWASPQSDIYSLGVVLYELLCHVRPFKSESTDLLEQVRSRTPVPPRSVDDTMPKALDAVCMQALAKDPSQRFRTGATSRLALRAAVAPERKSSLGVLLGRASTILLAALGIGMGALWLQNEFGRGRDPQSSQRSQLAAQTAPIIQTIEFSHVYREGDIEKTVLLNRAFNADHEYDHMLPLRPGDWLDLHAEFDKPAYAYLYCLSEGQTDLIWPLDSFAAPPDPDSKFTSANPHREVPDLVTPAGKVACLFVLGISDEPVADDRLEKISGYALDWKITASEAAEIKKVFSFRKSKLAEVRITEPETFRSDPDEPPPRRRRKLVLPKDLEDHLSNAFSAWMGYAFPLHSTGSGSP